MAENVLLLAAGIAFFLYGVDGLGRIFSRMAGGRIQTLLDRHVATDGRRYLAGLGATIAFQSSSATTVLLVGMTSAGLLTASEAFSFTLGANLGSVSTGWIAAIKITVIGLPIFICGVIGFFLSSRTTFQHLFGFCIGLGIILFGLDLMGQAVTAVRENRVIIETFSRFDVAHSPFSLFFVVLCGILFTAIIQSSGATLAIAVAATNNGLFTIHQACALSLGATLGTTATTLLASIRSGIEGRRIAVMHTGANLCGVIGGTILFYPLVKMTTFLASPGGNGIVVTLYLTFHKIVLSILLFLWRHRFAETVERIIPDPFPGVRQRISLPEKIADSAETCAQIRSQIMLFYRYLRDMAAFSLIVSLKHSQKTLFTKIEQYEQIVDQGHKRIVRLLHDTADQPQTERWLLLKMSAEAESIGDHLKSIASYGRRIRERAMIPRPLERLLIHSAHRRVFTFLHRVCIKREFRTEDLFVSDENELAIRRDKRRLLLSLTEGADLLDPDTVLEVADILSEYSKVNHSVRRILQVNLDMIQGQGIYRYEKSRGSPCTPERGAS